jgi:predicted nucleotidyltransferase
MQFTHALNEIFKSSVHVRVLRALTELPQGFGVSGREIARRAGVSHPSATKSLGALAIQGVVTVRRALRSDEYTLNYDHVLTSSIRALFDAERRIVEDVRSRLQSDLERLGVRRAYLFGSAVRGEASARSDIDLAIEPTKATKQLDQGVEAMREQARRRYGNELSVIVKQMPSTQRSDAMWRRLLKDSIPIFGDTR